MEEVANNDAAQPLVDAPWQARREFRRMRIDTIAGMAISNIVALAIMVGTAATLHAAGETSIGTAGDAARALQPIAGKLAFLLFSLGIIGTGLLAVPVLAGSTAYADRWAGECGQTLEPQGTTAKQLQITDRWPSARVTCRYRSTTGGAARPGRYTGR